MPLTYPSPCPRIIGPVLSGALSCVREREEAVTGALVTAFFVSGADRRPTADGMTARVITTIERTWRHSKKPPKAALCGVVGWFDQAASAPSLTDR